LKWIVNNAVEQTKKSLTAKAERIFSIRNSTVAGLGLRPCDGAEIRKVLCFFSSEKKNLL
jgi:hypothetical protein